MIRFSVHRISKYVLRFGYLACAACLIRNFLLDDRLGMLRIVIFLVCLAIIDKLEQEQKRLRKKLDLPEPEHGIRLPRIRK